MTTATAAATTTKKTRKTCALPACSQQRGECMHCACDGRCGRHTRGLCGLRREGNARECREVGCPRDTETCRHSRRATCSHCRYATASASSRKRQRAQAIESPQSPTSCDAVFTTFPGDTKRPRCPSSSSQSAIEADDDQDDFDLSVDMPLVPRETPRALCEYAAWASRRATCNLVVLVHGVQFNLHTFPMLLRSRRLHAIAQDQRRQTTSAGSGSGGAVVVLELATFPGDAEAFDAVCVFVYTGVVLFSPASFASLACAIEALELGPAASALAMTYLHSLSLSALVAVTLNVFRLAEQHSDAWPVVQDVLTRCIDAVARALPRTPRAMEAILVLPRSLFVRIGQAIYRLEAGTENEEKEVDPLVTSLLSVHLDADVGLRAAAQCCMSLLTSQVTLTPTVAGSESLTELLFEDVELLSSALHVDTCLEETETASALDPIAFLFLKSSADVSRIEISSEIAAS